MTPDTNRNRPCLPYCIYPPFFCWEASLVLFWTTMTTTVMMMNECGSVSYFGMLARYLFYLFSPLASTNDDRTDYYYRIERERKKNRQTDTDRYTDSRHSQIAGERGLTLFCVRAMKLRRPHDLPSPHCLLFRCSSPSVAISVLRFPHFHFILLVPAYARVRRVGIIGP